MRIWQISPPASMAGPIAEYFIRNGVVLLWPGDLGRWTPERYGHEYALSDWLKWFAETAAVGDAILLRIGPARIRAVGLVAGEYTYEDRFDDVHGFDLQHCRRVRWCRLPEDYDFAQPVFSKGRFSLVRKAQVHDYVTRFLASPPTQWWEAGLPALPAEEPLTAEIPSGLENVVGLVRDLGILYTDTQRFGEPPMEDELVAHFVVPLLRALGWPPERLSVKWHRIDVAVFDALPRTPENCRFVIEVKRPGAVADEALEQAKGYVHALGKVCDIVVTDGIRYRMYSGREDFAQIAYANLLRLKHSAANLFARLRRP